MRLENNGQAVFIRVVRVFHPKILARTLDLTRDRENLESNRHIIGISPVTFI